MAIHYNGLKYDGHDLHHQTLHVSYCWPDKRHAGLDMEFQCWDITFTVHGFFSDPKTLHLEYSQYGNGATWCMYNDVVQFILDPKSDYEPQYYKFYRIEMIDFITQWLRYHGKDGHYNVSEVQRINTSWHVSRLAAANATSQRSTNDITDIEHFL